MDSTFLLEKIYALFINDFWIDYLKINGICTRADWGNFIGSKFFEPFVNLSFKEMFQNQNNSKTCYLSTDDLKLSYSGSEIEYADFYFRSGKNIMLAQAKSNYLPLINGYKTINTLKDFQELDAEHFYESFGLYQFIEKSICQFNKYRIHLKDFGLQSKGSVKIYPVLIINEPILSLGITQFVFRKKFETLLEEKNILKETNSIQIMPLAILNVSELLEIEEIISKRHQTIFNLLEMQFARFQKENINHNTDLIIPFSSIINKIVPNNLKIPQRIQRFDWLGF